MSKPTVITLFTGAGGLDYGFEAAGFETRAAIEAVQPVPSKCLNLVGNHPDHPGEGKGSLYVGRVKSGETFIVSCERG